MVEKGLQPLKRNGQTRWTSHPKNVERLHFFAAQLPILGFVRCELLRVILGTKILRIPWLLLHVTLINGYSINQPSRDRSMVFFWTNEVRWKIRNITRSIWIWYCKLMIFDLEVAQWIKCICIYSIWIQKSYISWARSFFLIPKMPSNIEMQKSHSSILPWCRIHHWPIAGGCFWVPWIDPLKRTWYA